MIYQWSFLNQLKAINDIPDVVSEKDKAGRVDLRNVQMVTIDGEDAEGFR